MKHITFKKSKLACCIAFSCSISSVFAAEILTNEQIEAAQRADEDIEVIQVSGIRASRAASLNAKRFSNQITESITAEDIGKMPDQNISESLQRLPGVQIDRANGTGTSVRIRGIGENATFLNGDTFISGLEQVKNGIAGPTVRSLSSLESIPSELLSGVEVFKSPNAKLVEGGIGGAIDLKTRDGFSLDEFVVAGNVKGIYGTESEETTPAFAVVVGNNFNDVFAVVASISSTKTDLRQRGAQSTTRTNWDIVNADGTTSNPDKSYGTGVGEMYILPEMFQPYSGVRTSERLGSTLSLQYRPTDGIEIGADWFHSELNTESGRMNVKYHLGNSEAPLGIDPNQDFDIDDNGVINYATLTSHSNEVNTTADKRDTTADNYALYAKYDQGDAFRISGRYTFAKSEQSYEGSAADVRQSQYSVPFENASSPTGWQHDVPNVDAPNAFDLTYQNGSMPYVRSSVTDLVSNNTYGHFKSHWAAGNNSTYDADSLRVDGEYDFDIGPLTTVSFGARIATKESDWDEGLYLTDFSTAAIPGETVAYPDGTDGGINGTYYRYTDAIIGGLLSPDDTTTNQFGQGTSIIPWDNYSGVNANPDRIQSISDFGSNMQSTVLGQSYEQMLAQGPMAWRGGLYPNNPSKYFKNPITTYNAKRETQAIYAMADFEGEIGNMEYALNVGGRYIKTDITINNFQPQPGGRLWGTHGWNGVPRDVDAVETKQSYDDFLPSLNFVLNLDDEQKLRFSAAKVMSEQVLDDLGAGFDALFIRNQGCNCFVFTGGTNGNPELDPYRASQFDVSYEWYFTSESLFSATVFYKDVESFISKATVQVNMPDGSPSGSTTAGVTTNINGEGGSVAGFELGLQHVFPMGIGFAANYTYSDSQADSLSSYTKSALGIPGVSESAYNLMGFYESDNFQLRIAYTWRDDYLAPEYSQFAVDDKVFAGYYGSYGQLDASMSYDVSDNFTLTFEAINLAPESQTGYLEYENNFFFSHESETRYQVGVGFSF